jgi:hypothetical protein
MVLIQRKKTQIFLKIINLRQVHKVHLCKDHRVHRKLPEDEHAGQKFHPSRYRFHIVLREGLEMISILGG